MQDCKDTWKIDTEDMYNPLSNVTFELYVKHMNKTLSSLLS